MVSKECMDSTALKKKHTQLWFYMCNTHELMPITLIGFFITDYNQFMSAGAIGSHVMEPLFSVSVGWHASRPQLL